MRRTPAPLRYLALHRLAFAVTALTVLVTAASTAATAVFAASAATLANRESLTDNPGSLILVSAQVTPSAQVTTSVTTTIGRGSPGLPMQYLAAAMSSVLNLPASVGGPNAQTQLIGLPQLPRHAVLVTGSWPSPAAAGPVQACLPAAAAQALKLRAGDDVPAVDVENHAHATIRLACTFRERDPAGAYWRLDPMGPGAISKSSGFTSYGPMVTSQAPARWPIAATDAEWLAIPDFGAMTAPNLTTLGNGLGLVLSNFSNSALAPTIITNLPTLLTDQAITLEVARSQLLIWQLVLLVVVGASLAVAVQLLAIQRANEPGLLMARGATRRQLAARGATDAAILAIPAAILGPLIGARAAPLIARLHLLGTGSVAFPTSLPLSAWYAGIAVATGCALIIALPWLRTPLTPIQRRAGTARQRTIGTILSSGADVALVLLAAGAAWQLSHYSAPVTTGVSGYIGVDPVLVAAPVLALTAGTLVMLRLLPLLIRLTERIAVRGRGITVPTAAWMIGRRTMRQAGSALLTVLAVATAVVALAQTASWRQSIADQAAFTVGADTSVALPAAAPMPVGAVADISGATGVKAAVPVIKFPDVLPNNDTVTVLALDPKQARQVVPLRRDLLARGFPDPLAAIIGHAGAPGEPLPGTPDQLRVVASLSKSGMRQAQLSVQLTDAVGIGYQVPVGALPADGSIKDLTVPVPAGDKAAYPLSITGFSLAYLLPGSGTGQTATLAIRSLSVSGPGQPAQPVPAMWPAGNAPQPAIAGLDLANGGGGYPHAYQPSIAGLSEAGHGAVLRFRTGAGLSNRYVADGRVVSVPAYATLNVSAAPPEFLPAIATKSFLAASGERLGQYYQIGGLPIQIPVLLVADVAQFPTIGGSGGGLIINQAALQSFVEANGAGSEPVTQWWLRASGQPKLSHLPVGTSITTQAEVASSLSSQPLTLAPEDSLVAVAAIALLLACFGFLVNVTVSKERGRDLAVLDALGASPSQLTRLLCLEQGMLSLPAAVGGLALGLLLCQLIIPAVTLTSAAAHPIPAVIVRVPVVLAGVIAAIIAAVPVVAVALSIRRPSATVARLRAEEEA